MKDKSIEEFKNKWEKIYINYTQTALEDTYNDVIKELWNIFDKHSKLTCGEIKEMYPELSGQFLALQKIMEMERSVSF